LMMNPVPWLQMTNMISYQGLVRTFPSPLPPLRRGLQIDFYHEGLAVKATHYIEDMKSFTHMKYDLLQPK
ncbi:hypothetical protein, partial [Raoultella ornithinolytica]|uniref:hypothetical protein n=1 Tax=Raoultella ornithinolytica TaxID=54291 RepID=UPI00403D7EF0